MSKKSHPGDGISGKGTKGEVAPGAGRSVTGTVLALLRALVGR